MPPTLKRKQRAGAAGQSVHKQKKRKSQQQLNASTVQAPPAEHAKGGDNDDFEDLEVASEGGSDVEEGALDEQRQVEQPVKKKKPKQKKARKKSALHFEASRELAGQIAGTSPEVQAEWLWESYSAVTAAGYLEREAFRETSLVQMANEGGLEQRLAAAEPAWEREFCGAGESEPDRPPGCPSLLLVSPSAVGANELLKKLPNFNVARKAAKLFAKHFKVHEQVALLGASRPCVASGTPHRLCKLADVEALKLQRLRLLVIDVRLDAKQRTMLDMPETRSDFWELFRKHIQPRVVAGHTKIALLNGESLEPGPSGAS